ncbi:MAG: hypothetical protein OXU96_05915, partial [Gammaproteobacteria bacterium]|nr:hypothetical protein [Gammaproteobacteria bacterium]
MKLTRKQPGDQAGAGQTISRRAFLQRSGLALGSGAAAVLGPGRVVKTHAASASANGDVVIKKSVCTHCSVGCGVVAEVQNGVWTGQEPD